MQASPINSSLGAEEPTDDTTFGLPLSNFDLNMLPFKLRAFVSSKLTKPSEPTVSSDYMSEKSI